MKPSYPSPETETSAAVRERIIGLGAGSARKSYYPQLQAKIHDLEDKQVELMETVRALEERETELERVIEEKQALLKEVHHRVKNNFQIIGSLLSLGLGLVGTKKEATAFSKTKRRIDTMAMVYAQLLASERFVDLDICELITQVANSLYYEAELPAVRLRYTMSCTDLSFEVDRAIPFSLLLNEAVSNALQHAYPDKRGELAISFGFADDRKGILRLAVEDDGRGTAEGELPTAGSTLGLTLISALAMQLKADWRYERRDPEPGLRFVLEFQERLLGAGTYAARTPRTNAEKPN